MVDITAAQNIYQHKLHLCLWHFTWQLEIWSVPLSNGIYFCVFLASVVEKKRETKKILRQGPSLPVITFFLFKTFQAC